MEGVKLYLENRSKFVVNDRDRNIVDIISSHVLFSGIINTLSLFIDGKELEREIKHFLDDELRISSLFLGIDIFEATNKIKSIYFLPKPSSPIISSGTISEKQVKDRKKIKQIKYFSQKLMKEIGKTWDNKNYRFIYDLDNIVVLGEDMALHIDELSEEEYDRLKDLKISSNMLVEKNQVARNYQDDILSLFEEEELTYIYYKKDNYLVKPFLYFLYNGELTENINLAIKLLAETGIGGSRSTGAGKFSDVEFIDTRIKNIETSSIFLNLSTFIPKKQEIKNLVSYDLDKLNGYIYSKGVVGFRKPTIGIIEEGAIFDSRLEGLIKDTSPKGLDLGHKVYTYGKAFNLGIGDSYE